MVSIVSFYCPKCGTAVGATPKWNARSRCFVKVSAVSGEV